MKTLFFITLFLVFYTYIGYAILITILNGIKKMLRPLKIYSKDPEHSITLIVPCYNEGDFMEEKLKNTLNLKYPKELLEIIFITDGTDDHSLDIVKNYTDQLIWMHSDERKGKAAAMNRAVDHAKHDILVFCDANTYINEDALYEISAPYKNPKVGAVSGEKRIIQKDKDHTSSAGEGLYWKYESWLKRMDSEFLTLVGAAGELMSYRKAYYNHIPEDSILDDFMASMDMAMKGYKVVYTPKAYAMETASANIAEEWKRKVRIAAGGWQSMTRLWKALIPIPNPILTFMYLSHRAFRWSVAPIGLVLLLLLNLPLAIIQPAPFVYLLIGQILFYLIAAYGYAQDKKGKKSKVAYIPYYFTFMNVAVLAGIIRFFKGQQKATWERAKRA